MAKYNSKTATDTMVANQIALMYADDETISNINDTGLYDQTSCTSYVYNTTVRYEEI